MGERRRGRQVAAAAGRGGEGASGADDVRRLVGCFIAGRLAALCVYKLSVTQVVDPIPEIIPENQYHYKHMCRGKVERPELSPNRDWTETARQQCSALQF